MGDDNMMDYTSAEVLPQGLTVGGGKLLSFSVHFERVHNSAAQTEVRIQA